MMHAEARRLFELYLANARTTPSELFAEENLNKALGLLGYAVVAGDISPAEHSASWELVRLIRFERKETAEVVRALA